MLFQMFIEYVNLTTTAKCFDIQLCGFSSSFLPSLILYQ